MDGLFSQVLPPTHPIADIWPLLDEAALEALAEDIVRRGQLLPIVRVAGLIIDGRNRWIACQRAGVEPWVIDVETDDPDGLAWSLNEHRRHASESVRAMAAARRANLPPHRPGSSSVELVTQADAAVQFGVSVATLKRAKVVIDHGSPEIVEAVERGDLAVSLAEKALRRIENTGTEFTSVADLKKFVRDVWREDHPPPPKTNTPVAAPKEQTSHVSLDTFEVVRAIVRHAAHNPVAQTAAAIDKWTGLNILDDLPPAIDYLTELRAALSARGE